MAYSLPIQKAPAPKSTAAGLGFWGTVTGAIGSIVQGVTANTPAILAARIETAKQRASAKIAASSGIQLFPVAVDPVAGNNANSPVAGQTAPPVVIASENGNRSLLLVIVAVVALFILKGKG